MITIQKFASNFQNVSCQSPDIYCTPNCVLEDRVQYNTVHIPNVFCDERLKIINWWGLFEYTEFFIAPQKKKSGAQSLFDHPVSGNVKV
jgi:hypothetical protein